MKDKTFELKQKRTSKKKEVIRASKAKAKAKQEAKTKKYACLNYYLNF